MRDDSRKLLEDNMGLIHNFFIRHHIWDEDMKQQCILKVCEYIDNYDPTKANLSTYIEMIMNSAISTEIQKRDRLIQHSGGSLDKTTDEEGAMDIYDLIPDIKQEEYFNNVIDDLDAEIFVENFIPFFRQNLTEEQQEMLDLMLTGYSNEDIVEITNTSRQNVSARINLIRSKARKYWEIYNEN